MHRNSFDVNCLKTASSLAHPVLVAPRASQLVERLVSHAQASTSSTTSSQEVPQSASISRRSLLATVPPLLGLCHPEPALAWNKETCIEQFRDYVEHPDYTKPGPLRTGHLPKLEHTCTSCFPACAGTNCLIRIDVTYPKGGYTLGLGPPYPLAIFTSGFLVNSEAYRSYAERLASWGYTVLLYDKLETVSDILDDVTSVKVVRELIDWATYDPLLRRLTDARSVYLVGHSRGGKISALAAVADPRVVAACLLDPVDNTVYAPLAPGYPSALAALQDQGQEQGHVQSSQVPLAVVGSGQGGDCAPRESNYRRFFEAGQGPCWEVSVADAGHFQYVDNVTPLQRAVCPTGEVEDRYVRDISQAVMVAWAEAWVRRTPGGHQTRSLGAEPYPRACQQPVSPPVGASSGAQRNPAGAGVMDVVGRLLAAALGLPAPGTGQHMLERHAAAQPEAGPAGLLTTSGAGPLQSAPVVGGGYSADMGLQSGGISGGSEAVAGGRQPGGTIAGSSSGGAGPQGAQQPQLDQQIEAEAEAEAEAQVQGATASMYPPLKSSFDRLLQRLRYETIVEVDSRFKHLV